MSNIDDFEFTGNLGYNGLDVTLNYFTNQPDITKITNPDLIVIFKSLSKKDPKTKEKALQELLSFIKDQDPKIFDDPILQCWVQLYPKISIDNSKTVRSLTHQIQGSLLQSIGSKNYGKYLKTTIPIWLMGIFDPDKSVSNIASSKLLENFQGDQSKIDKIWEIFEDQILNLVGTIINVEQPETISDPRYTNESEVQIKYDRVLNIALQILLKLIKNSSKKTLEINTIIESDSIWQSLTTSVEEETMNLGLFKTILILILRIFNNEKVEFDTKSIYKPIGKSILKIKFSKQKPALIYSSVIIPFWEVLLNLTRFAIINKEKKNFWEYSSKSPSRLKSYFELGCCDSDPKYFEILFSLFREIRDNNIDVVTFSSEKDSDFYINNLLIQYEKIRDSFKPGCLKCLLKFISLFDSDELPKVLEKVIDNLSRIRNKLTRNDIQNQICDYENSDKLSSAFETLNKVIQTSPDKYTETFISNYFQILKTSGFEENIEDLIEVTITKWEDKQIEDPIMLNYTLPYVEVMKKFAPRMKDVTYKIVNNVKGQSSFDLINTINKENLLQPQDLSDLINDVYDQFTINDDKDFFLSKVEVDIDERKYPNIYKYIQNKSTTDTLDPSYLNKLIEKSDTKALESIIEHLDLDSSFVFMNTISNHLSLIIDLNIDQILHTAWSNVDESKQFLNSLKEDYQEIYFDSMIRYLSSCSIQTKLDSLVNFVRDDSLPIDLIFDTFGSSINNLSPFEIAISNPLDSAIYLSDYGSKPLVEIIPILTKFLFKVNSNNEKLQTLMMVGKEYIKDFLFIQNLSDEVEKDLQEILSSSHEVPLDIILGDKNQLVELTDGNSLMAFYAARVLTEQVENQTESMSLSQFESTTINLNQLVKTPFKFIAVINGFKKFIHSKLFDRIRNYVFSEILVVKKEEDILTLGLKWITMIIPFMSNDHITEADIFPVVKLSMVLKQIDSWFDSSISYDAAFIDMRIQALKFLALLPNVQRNLPDSYYDLINKILSDNLDMADDRIDLKYYTLKAYVSLDKEKEYLENQDERLLEIFTNTTEANVHISYIVEEVLKKALIQSKIPISTLKSNQPQILQLFSKSSSITVQRLCVFFLSQIYENEKDDFIVEYQLSKDENKKAQLPSELLQIIAEFKIEENHQLSRYMLSWLLISSFFKDITISIRNSYLNQILEHKDLQNLLYLIFEHIDINNKFMLPLPTQDFSHYDIIRTDYHDLDYNLKLIGLNIYYNFLRYSGFQVQMWFQEIRDRQLQMKVEKLTTQYLSPPIINEILQSVDDEKDKLQGKEDNLTIKVNFVSNEIKTTYIVDEQKLEMVIKIPVLYPLENVILDGPSRVGVKENRWKAWILASQKILTLQNGSIIDSIELFCKNINLHFSGFEDCAICYSILHQDLSLPSKTCQTCNNKFHAACLYKWFKSSGNSTCPLCRSAFNFKYRG
ncbi:uncharacterized protein KGF55_002337 [Candida pseudojiufengensis]|uniref:uncharacterized protein n=1 Tax=Candida pseudojiufengensis TaxID=497109 RepID=UPI002224039D|nr:uncharacterized protein KGF55_002337 [Candida pseudojiufengensis]KAI5963457.1 hypothetical protein KGF55_002337 [Candida pseudojiufengensis]